MRSLRSNLFLSQRMKSDLENVIDFLKETVEVEQRWTKTEISCLLSAAPSIISSDVKR